MAIAVIMPKQGQSVESCIITALHKKKGDTVKKGEVLFSYETDKASFEEESPVDGTVLVSFYGEGDEVPVLENMMIIGEPGEDISALSAPASAEKARRKPPLLLTYPHPPPTVTKFPPQRYKRCIPKIGLSLRVQRSWPKRMRYRRHSFLARVPKAGLWRTM